LRSLPPPTTCTTVLAELQLSLTLYVIAVAVLGFFVGPLVVVLFLVAGIVVVYGVVMSVVNGLRARNGDEGAYALSTQFLR
jgi:hypothetical protein